MRARVFWLVFLRLLTLIFSLGTLACHIANIVLLNQYASSNNTGSWWPNYVPYILYFVGPAVSTVSSLALNIVSASSITSVRGDRFLSILNAALMIAVIVYNTLKSGVVPWTNGVAEGPSSVSKGFANYCSIYSDQLTFYRCWLSNGMWLGILIIVVFWVILGVYVIVQNSSDIYDDDYDVYDFKDDMPMAASLPTRQYDSESSPGHHHATSPVEPSPTSHPSNTGHYPQNSGYPEYDSYYDYPPKSSYPVYNRAPHGDYAAYNYNNGSSAPDRMGDQTQTQQQQYYSSVPINSPSAPHTQTPNAY